MKNSKQIFRRGLLSCMVAALAMGFAVAQEDQEETVDQVINDYSTLFEDAELTRAIFEEATPTPTNPACPWGIFKSRMNHANGFGLTDGTGSYDTENDAFRYFDNNKDFVYLKPDGIFSSGKPRSIYYAITIRYKNITSEASWYKFSVSAQYTSGDAMHLTLLYLNPASDRFEKVLSFHRIDQKKAESTAETFFVYMPAGSAVYIAANADRQDGYADLGKYDYLKAEAVSEEDIKDVDRVYGDVTLQDVDCVGSISSADVPESEENSSLISYSDYKKVKTKNYTPVQFDSNKLYYIKASGANVYWNSAESDQIAMVELANAGKYRIVKDNGKSFLYDVDAKSYVVVPAVGNGKAWVKSTSNVNGVFVSKRTDTLFELKCSDAGGAQNCANALSGAKVGNKIGNWSGGDWLLQEVPEVSAPALDITKLTSGDIEGLIAVADEMDTPMTYTATVSAAGYSTLCVPFDAELPAESEVEAYSLTDVADGAVQGEKVSSIEANKPVLLKNEGILELTSTAVAAPESTVNGLLTGVYASEVIPEGSYVLQKQSEEVAFFRVGATQPTVVPFRAYLTVPNNQAPILRIGGATTGVEHMPAMEDQPSVVYDMMGREVASPVKGIYIVNGKKMVIK